MDWYAELSNAGNLSQTSKDSYATRIRAVLKASGQPSIERLVCNPTKTRDLVVKRWEGIESQRNMLVALNSLLLHAPGVAAKCTAANAKSWNEICKRSQHEVDERRDKSMAPARQVAKYLSWDEIIEARKRGLVALLAEQDPQRQKAMSMVYLLVCMYTMIDPARNDYHALFVQHPPPARTPPANTNIVRLEEDGGVTLLLSQFKTAARYHLQEQRLPDELGELIRSSVRKYPRSWLFEPVRKPGEPFTAPNFQMYIAQSFRVFFGRDPPPSINTLRHARVNSLSLQAMSKAARRVIAKNMMHSLETQMDYLQLNV
jgi:hypothetical protein